MPCLTGALHHVATDVPMLGRSSTVVLLSMGKSCDLPHLTGQSHVMAFAMT